MWQVNDMLNQPAAESMATNIQGPGHTTHAAAFFVDFQAEFFFLTGFSRLGSSTRRAPQSLHQYCWLPQPLVPFLTMFLLPHVRH